MKDQASPPNVDKLAALVARLRAPDGCPWDREQTVPDLRAYLLEEAHEVADAIDRGNLEDLAGELGDLLFQIVFLAALGKEAGAFDLAQVIDGIHTKMVARHPHVFGSDVFGTEQLADADAVRTAWEVRKSQEKEGEHSLLAGVPRAMPALLGAYRMTQKAAGIGFDWPDLNGVWDKIDEEFGELRAEVARRPDKANRAAIQEELGDLLFALVNLGRKLDIDPEAALAGTNLKFRRRFGAVEKGLREKGIEAGKASLDEMDALWERAKKEEAKK